MEIINESDFPQFLSQAPHKTPRARVTVTALTFASRGYMYEVPAGFLYDKYLSWRYPDFTIQLRGIDGGWEANIVDGDGEVVETHTGTYIQNNITA